MGDGFPTRLRDLIDPLGKKLGMGDAVAAGRVFERWVDIVGNDVAAHVEPTSLRDGVLRVRADSPAWATEIGYLTTEIAVRINRALGREVVTEIRVSAGAKADRPAPSRRMREPRAEPARGPDEAPADDPREAFERARAAWLARSQKSRSDQDF